MEYSPNLAAAYLAGKVDEYVKQQGRDTIAGNVASDEFARWARIPDGKACDFCNMLGSRGFVYHSEEKAGGNGNDYHPHCNCQVAVSFDPDMEYYYKNGVRVSRGYSGDAEHARMMDDLYAEYRAAGKRFASSSTYRRYSNTMPAEQFDTAMRRLSDAKSLDELHAAGREIVDKWPGGAANADKTQWDELSRHARELEKFLTRERIVNRSIGARTISNFDVRVPGFENSQIIADTEIEAEHVFAGAGSYPYSELRAAERLANTYGGEPEEWSHTAGDVWMFDPLDGKIRKAEVHWFEHPDYGMQEFWWKRWRET